MKQLLFLLLFPCFAMAQYQGNGNQKITLGEQTTADGLVWRGIRADTTSKIVPFSDTSAYIILDTVEKTLWLYKAGQIPKWQQVGGSAGGTTIDTASMLTNYYRAGRSGIIQVADVPTLNQNTTGSAATLTTARNIRTNLASAYGANFDGSTDITPGVSGVLGAGNGGTGASNFGSPNRIPFVSSSGSLTTDTFFAYNGTTQRLGVGVPNPTEKLHVSGNGLFTGSMSLGTPLSVANGGTGSATQNFVDLSTTQTVNGLKTFKDSLFLGDVVIGKTKGNNSSVRFGIGAGLTAAPKNVAIGTSTLQNDAVGENVAIGFEAGQKVTTGTRNMLLGSNAGSKLTTGGSNVVFGSTALFNMVTGSANVAVGRAAMEQGTIASFNTAMGYAALYSTEGDYNTAVGSTAGWVAPGNTNKNTTGSNNTFIGNEAVGESSTTSNHITLGNSSITKLRCQVALTTYSDGRDKTDILPLNYGMNFIDKLKPVSFVWDMRDGGKIGIPEIGFIAQDLQQAQIDLGINVPNLVSGTDEKLDVTYNTLLPIIVKALQEANEKIKSLEQRIINLENK